MFKLPREHGLTSLWLATLLYSLVQIKTFNTLVLLSVLGSIFVLLTSDSILERLIIRDFRGAILRASLLLAFYLPIAYYRFWSSLVLIVIALILLALLVYSLSSAGITHYATIIGSSLMSLHSIFILVAENFSSLELKLYPILYVLTSTSQASIRVLGYEKNVMVIFYASIASSVLYGYTAYFTSEYDLAFYTILLDCTLRLVQEFSSFSRRASIRVYGFLELFRSIVVLIVVGLSLRFSS